MSEPDKQLLKSLQEIQAAFPDPESQHIRADQALVDFLRALGLHEQADLFVNLKKWYA